MCTQIPTDVIRLIRSFANEHDVLAERDVFLTAIHALQKVSPFISVRFRSEHTATMVKDILRLVKLGARVPKDGVQFHNFRYVRQEFAFARKHFSWRPSSIGFTTYISYQGPRFPYL